MKNKYLSTAVILFCASASLSAQTIHSFMRPMGSLSDVKTGIFSSIEAGFSIDLPRSTGGFGGSKGMQYSWRLKEGYFFVGIEDRENDVENSANWMTESEAIANGFFNDFARDLFSSKFEVKKLEKNESMFLTRRTFDVRAELTDTVAVIRIFWVGNRAYKLGVLFAKDQLLYEPQARKAFESIKINSKEVLDQLVAKKLEENTPKPLPQSPVAKRLTSDAIDEGLKGKVKSVIEHIQFIAGDKKGSPKRIDEEDFYNSNGDLEKSIDYDDTNGLPFQIRVFGYLDLKRVSRTGTIFYGNEITGIALSETPGRRLRFDSRYDNRYGYKYDKAGKLIEKIFYGNAGNVITRRVFKNSKDSIEETVYDEAGAVNMRSISKIDSRGNPLSTTYFDSPMKGWDSIYTIDYLEFEETGNWVKQNMTMSRRFQGMTKDEWTMTITRTITYYP